MIESFIVKNYMSYRDQVELSFLASKKEKSSALPPEWYQEIDGKRILRLLLCVGLNGTGKSKMFSALNYLRMIATNNQRIYNKEKDTVTIKFGQACDLSKNDQRMLEASVIQNSTVLSVFGALNLESFILRQNYDYFSQRISLVRRGDQSLADRLQTGDQERDKRVKTLLLKLLADVGTNIVDYEVDDASVLISDLVKSGAPEIVVKAMQEQYPTGIISHKNLRFIHSTAHAGKKSLDGGVESFGTINIIRLLVVIYDIVMGRKCSCIDEIDAGIHAKALAFIIKMYLSIAENCQIAVATHDLSLLGNPDLRRDAVRMFEKDENGSTYIRKHVYVHNTINFQKQYSKNLDPKLDELMAKSDLFIEYRDLVSEFLKELQKLQDVK